MKPKFIKGLVGLIAGIVLLGSVFTVVYAQEKEIKSSPEKEALTISEVLERAGRNNLDFQKASLTLDNDRIAYEKAKANILQSQSKIDEKQAELNWEQAQNTFETSKNKIEIEIISLYNDCKYLTSLLPLTEEKVQLAENSLSRVREKVKAGTTGKLEELAAEISLEAAQQQLRNTEQQLEIARENFSLTTDIKDIWQFDLISEFEQDAPEGPLDIYIASALENRKETEFEQDAPEGPLDIYIASALENREEIQFARKNVEIASDRLEQLKITGSPRLDIDKADNDLELVRISLSLLKESIKSEVRQKYYQLESLGDQLQLLSLQLDEAQRNFENATKQFQAGLITEDELSSKGVSFQEAYLELQKNKASRYVAYLDLRISAGEVLELGEGNEG